MEFDEDIINRIYIEIDNLRTELDKLKLKLERRELKQTQEYLNKCDEIIDLIKESPTIREETESKLLIQLILLKMELLGLAGIFHKANLLMQGDLEEVSKFKD